MIHPKQSFIALGNGMQRILESAYTVTGLCWGKAAGLRKELRPPIPPFRVAESGRGWSLIHQIAKNPHFAGHRGLPECSRDRFSVGDMQHRETVYKQASPSKKYGKGGEDRVLGVHTHIRVQFAGMIAPVRTR
jgi:hypothetical protein